MGRSKNIILLTLITVLAQGCALFYIPNMVNAPTLKEKEEIRATLNPRNGQISYAVTENVGIMFNGNVRMKDKEGTYIDTNEIKYPTLYKNHSYFIEGGGGYFKPLGETGIFDIFTGAGLGHINLLTESPVMSGKANSDFYRIFVQPDIGVSNEYIDFIFSARISSIKFSNNASLRLGGFEGMDSINLYISNKELYTFVEPAITFRVGYKMIKAHFQAKLVLSPAINLGYNPFGFNFGLHFDIANQWNEKPVEIKQ